MPVYHSFDFLRVNLQSTDIDDTATPSDKIVAVAAQFDHIAGVNESIRVDQCGYVSTDIGLCGALGAYTQRSFNDLHLYSIAVLVNKSGRKSLAAVGHGEADTRLSRCIGMADGSARKGLCQSIEHRLVCDLARKANVAGRKMRYRSAHQELSPMRRRAGNVGDAAGDQPGDIIGQWF